MSPAREPAPVQRLHIDTDPGLDDLLALALALASPELRLCSVTTVAGNASIDAVTENAQRFLALAGEAIPLGRGAKGPLALSLVDAETYHGADGRRGISIPALDRRPLPGAPEVLRAALAERRVDRVLALGPLTNVAALLQEERGLFDGVEVLWMGGTLSEGNATGVAEFNCYADPAALAAVLRSRVALRVIGLDVTRFVRLSPRDLPRFGTGPMGSLLGAVLAAQMDAEEPLAGERGATLHDPCALLAALPADLFRYEEKPLRVIVEEGSDRGRLIEGESAAADGGVAKYAVEVNSGAVLHEFRERLAAYCGPTPEGAA